MAGWGFQLEINSDMINGQYGSFEDLVPGSAEQLAEVLTTFTAAQLTSQLGVTSVVWDSVQVTRPTVEVLHEEP